jgi:hypothetical protein
MYVPALFSADDNYGSGAARRDARLLVECQEFIVGTAKIIGRGSLLNQLRRVAGGERTPIAF